MTRYFSRLSLFAPDSLVRPGSRVLGLVLLVLSLVLSTVGQAFALDGAVDLNFAVGSGANGNVYSMVVQSDGKILIVGAFTTYDGTSSNGIARLNSNGSLDTGFNSGGSGANSTVYSLALQSDGKILIGGNFTSYNGTSSNYLAQLNTNGSLDTSFNFNGTGADNVVVFVAAQSDGKALISGFFTSYNGTSRYRLARLNSNGSLDNGFTIGTGVGTSEKVYSIVSQSDGKILIGGEFSSYNGTSRNGIARLNSDGSLDNGFTIGTGANSGVYGIAVQSDGKILIGGSFTSYNGTAIVGVARVNSTGSLDTDFMPGSGTNNAVRSVVPQNDGKVLIGVISRQ